MSRATFKILFYLKRNAPKKNGLIPVMCRITVNGKIAQFSCKLDVFDRDTYVTAEKVRNEYLGMGMNHKTLLAVFRQHNEDYAKLVGKMKSQRSYWKYCVVYKHLSEFIKTRYKVEDIALKELATLDRKIQLELAPKHEETPSQGQEQGGGQDLPKAENVPKPDDAARDYIRDHIIIGRPGIPERREGHGMKM